MVSIGYSTGVIEFAIFRTRISSRVALVQMSCSAIENSAKKLAPAISTAATRSIVVGIGGILRNIASGTNTALTTSIIRKRFIVGGYSGSSVST